MKTNRGIAMIIVVAVVATLMLGVVYHVRETRRREAAIQATIDYMEFFGFNHEDSVELAEAINN